MNRAMEFLNESWRLLAWWGNCENGRALVRLAMGEVQELLDRIAELEAQRSVNGVLVVGLLVGDGAEIATRQEKRL